MPHSCQLHNSANGSAIAPGEQVAGTTALGRETPIAQMAGHLDLESLQEHSARQPVQLTAFAAQLQGFDACLGQQPLGAISRHRSAVGIARWHSRLVKISPRAEVFQIPGPRPVA